MVYVSRPQRSWRAHLKLLEEAKERDHRKIGKDMNLFMVDDLVGRGLPMFLPKGYVIWQELEKLYQEQGKESWAICML